MASAVIHMAVASEINRFTKRDNNKYLLGSIAPDISKLVGNPRRQSHFCDEDTDIPDMDKFLSKYKDYLNDDFVFGYFVHLYTDYLWEKYFIQDIYNEDNNMVTKIDGSKVKCYGRMLCQYIYNDYTNLNNLLIDEYEMDLGIFYNEIPELDNIIQEIPMDKLQVLIDKMSIIIENATPRKEFIFNIENVNVFIKRCVELTLAKIEELGLT